MSKCGSMAPSRMTGRLFCFGIACMAATIVGRRHCCGWEPKVADRPAWRRMGRRHDDTTGKISNRDISLRLPGPVWCPTPQRRARMRRYPRGRVDSRCASCPRRFALEVRGVGITKPSAVPGRSHGRAETRQLPIRAPPRERDRNEAPIAPFAHATQAIVLERCWSHAGSRTARTSTVPCARRPRRHKYPPRQAVRTRG